MVSKVKVGKKRIEKNREFSAISACASVNHCSLTVYKTNGHKRPPTFINREFCRILCKTHAISEILAFSICSLFWRTYAISTCHSLGKIKIQKKSSHKGLDCREQKKWSMIIRENISVFTDFENREYFSAQLKGLLLRNKCKMPRKIVKPATFINL